LPGWKWKRKAERQRLGRPFQEPPRSSSATRPTSGQVGGIGQAEEQAAPEAPSVAMGEAAGVAGGAGSE